MDIGDEWGEYFNSNQSLFFLVVVTSFCEVFALFNFFGASTYSYFTCDPDSGRNFRVGSLHHCVAIQTTAYKIDARIRLKQEPEGTKPTIRHSLYLSKAHRDLPENVEIFHIMRTSTVVLSLKPSSVTRSLEFGDGDQVPSFVTDYHWARNKYTV